MEILFSLTRYGSSKIKKANHNDTGGSEQGDRVDGWCAVFRGLMLAWINKNFIEAVYWSFLVSTEYVDALRFFRLRLWARNYRTVSEFDNQ